LIVVARQRPLLLVVGGQVVENAPNPQTPATPLRETRSAGGLIILSRSTEKPRIVGHPDLAQFRILMDRLFKDAARQSLAPIGDPLGILTGLKNSGYKIGIATNDSEYGAHEQANALGLMPILDFIAGYDSGHGGKPDPGMVHAFARHCGLHESEVALIGDSTHDLHAARAAGAVAIAVLSGPASRAVLEPHADHVIDSILDLPDLVKKL